MIIEYGTMSSKYSIEAENKLTAYCAICAQYDSKAFMVALYSPPDVKANDQWMSFDGKIAERLDEIFGGEGAFDKYFEDNLAAIKSAYATIKKLI